MRIHEVSSTGQYSQDRRRSTWRRKEGRRSMSVLLDEAANAELSNADR